jgi:hypothetical protein
MADSTDLAGTVTVNDKAVASGEGYALVLFNQRVARGAGQAVVVPFPVLFDAATWTQLLTGYATPPGNSFPVDAAQPPGLSSTLWASAISRGFVRPPPDPLVAKVAALRTLATQCVNDATDIIGGQQGQGAAPIGLEFQAVWQSFDGTGGAVLGWWGGSVSGAAASERLYRQNNGLVVRVAAWLGPTTAASDLKVEALVNGAAVGSAVTLGSGGTYQVGTVGGGYRAGDYIGLRLSVAGGGTLGAPVNVGAIARLVE